MSRSGTLDEWMLSVLADGLGLDERGYDELVTEMRAPRMDAAMIAQAQTIA